MKILYIGELHYGSTCLMRKNALVSLGHSVTGIDINPATSLIHFLDRFNYQLSYKFDFNKINWNIIDEFSKNLFDLVWIDKGKKIFPATLKKLKSINPYAKIIHINPDDPFGKFRTGWNNFIKSIPFYDVHFVAREVNVNEYKSIGAKKVYVYDRSFDPEIHKPIKLTEEEKKKYFCEVGFIGSWAIDREKSIVYLINNCIEVTVRGNGWQKGKYWNIIKKYYKGPGLNGIEYAKAINGMEIALHFLRKENRDEQDSRTFEIPACGTFMLAERSEKHEKFFKADTEAVFFDNNQDLLLKVNYYLNNTDKRTEIAGNGYERSITSGYNHEDRLHKLLQLINN